MAHRKLIHCCILFVATLSFGHIYGQITTPCGCSTFITVGTTGMSTDLHNIGPFQTARCYFLKGTIRVTDPTDWIGVRIQMEEGSQIKAEDELSLHGTYISGCDDMWKGIKAETNIFLYDSYVEDAEIGVQLKNSASIVCTNTKFINDFIGISVGDPLYGDATDVVVYRCQIWGCSFYTDPNLPDPYPGQYYYPSWPTTPTEIPYNQGFAGIYLSGVTGVNIGYQNATGGDRNQIYQMRNGIVLRNSTANLYSTDFYDFQGSQVRRPAEPVLDLNQYAVNSFRSHSIIDDNTVDNVLVGVFTHESFNTIQNNDFDLPKTLGTILFTKGIYALTPQTLLIDNNGITNGWRGILLESVHTPFQVVHNTLTRNITRPANVGIDIRTVKYGSNELGLVEDNDIDIEDGNGSIGINVNNVTRITVNDNDVEYTIYQGSDTQNRGIIVNGGGGSTFSNNVISADPEYKEVSNIGIHDFLSFNNGLTCNDLENFSHNLILTGANTSTGLYTNIFRDGLYGFYLEGPAMIGTQNHNGNQWVGSYSAFGAYLNSSTPVPTALQCQFKVDATENSDFFPYPLGPSSVIDIWFKDINNPKPTFTCEDEIINPFTEPDTLSKFLLFDPEFENYSDEMSWLVKADVYEMMKLEPTLHSNTVLDSFYDVEETNPLGKLVDWQSDLASRFGVQDLDKKADQDLMYLLAKEMHYEDSILAILPHVGSFSAWLTRRINTTDSLNTVKSDWLDLLDGEYTDSRTVYSDIQDDLENLTTGNDLEEHLRQALLFKTQYLLGDEFSSIDSVDLLELGQLCPWLGGRAIPVSQELFSTIADSTMIPNSDGCSSPSPFIMENHIAQNFEPEALTLYPNPTKDNFNVHSNDIILNLVIYDVGMYPLKDFVVQDYAFSSDMKDYPPGIYVVKIVTMKKTTFLPLTIVK